MTVSITRIVDIRGDFQMHLGGCRDIKRSHSYDAMGNTPQTYTGATLLDAIVAADTDMADWFGQKAYDPAPGESPWHVAGVDWAPCFTEAVKAAGIEFRLQRRADGVTPAARPFIAPAVAPVEAPVANTTPLRVQFSVSLDIDVEAYRAEYGPTRRVDIREAVKSSILSAIQTDGIVVADASIITVR